MDALDLLEQQHRDVSDLLNRIAVERSAGRRGFLVAQLVRLIDAHARVEERVFYPACVEQLRGSHERLYDACEEHALTRVAAATLLRTRATAVRFEARLRLVRHLFLRHAHEEERWMFPRVKRDLTDEQLDAMGNDIDRAFRLLLSLEQTYASTRRSEVSRQLTSAPAPAVQAPALELHALQWNGTAEGAEEARDPHGHQTPAPWAPVVRAAAARVARVARAAQAAPPSPPSRLNGSRLRTRGEPCAAQKASQSMSTFAKRAKAPHKQ